MNLKREVRHASAAMALTAMAALLAFWEIAAIAREQAEGGDWAGVATQIVFALAYLALVAGGMAYHFSRHGYLIRRLAHRAEDWQTLEARFADYAPMLAVLVPAYREEPSVVRRTLLSAALQDYPRRRVVLLIDDPYTPRNRADAANLSAMRDLPRTLQALFDPQATRFDAARRAFARACGREAYDGRSQAAILAGLYGEAADWVAAEISRYSTGDHSDALLLDTVLVPCRDAHRARAARLREQAGSAAGVDLDAATKAYRHLTAMFRVEFASFERKRYENLSHEANKAMNLNSYLALMGGSFREVADPEGSGLRLVPTPPGDGAIDVPDAELVLTLDADSVLLPDYAMRLADIMKRPGNERVAVAQTPYSAFPGAPGLTERIAGAQTDIQYLMHQGFTLHNATFWVGANALLRKAALEDIATEAVERGHRIRKYIQDRTVIEDTESSIDLADRGWTLYNYPVRLAYSATPPDFGSLLIQRRRWANGGLIILPKALRYLWRGARRRARLGEAFLRVHYLTSVALVNIAFLMIMFGPFERNLHIVWIPLSMLPYMIAYARDLVHCGYRWIDYPRVYALNLLLLPVNLGGTLRSLHQACTGRRAPFGRTPKVTGRTSAHGGYVVVEYGLLAATIAIGVAHLVAHRWMSTAMAVVYAGFLGYGMLRFIGLRASAEDVRLWLRPPADLDAAAAHRVEDAGISNEPVAPAGPESRPFGSVIKDAALRQTHGDKA